MGSRFIRDKSGRVVLWQSPNALLVGWAVLAIIGRLFQLQTVDWISKVFLLIWAFLEILKGVNFFRRALGLIVLTITIVTLFG